MTAHDGHASALQRCADTRLTRLLFEDGVCLLWCYRLLVVQLFLHYVLDEVMLFILDVCTLVSCLTLVRLAS